MPTITIPASEVREGDAISIGGNLRTVRVCRHTVEDTAEDELIVVYVDVPFRTTLSAIYFPASQNLIVFRDDDDAELVEAMAKAICESDGNAWPSRAEEGYRNNARAALAAYREHTQA